MTKDNIRDWETTASNNTDIAGIGIQGTNLPSNFDNALRTVMKQIADVDAGTEPVNDTWTFCDPADTTKRFRMDAGSVTTATTRVYTMPNSNGTLALRDVSQDFTAVQSITAATASAGDHLLGLRDNSTTVGDAGNVVISIKRQNSATACVNIGNTGNNAGAIGSENASTLFGSWNAGTFTEGYRLETSGNLLLGQSTTTTPGSGNTTNGIAFAAAGTVYSSRGSAACASFNRNTSDGTLVVCARGGTSVGSISVTATNTAYNTSSDYRRKPIQEVVSGFWGRIIRASPKHFQWDTGEWACGFIAHEFAEVYPNSVNGTKDEVDEEGNPVYQSMQPSTPEVMADIIAALQDISRRLAALEGNE